MLKFLLRVVCVLHAAACLLGVAALDAAAIAAIQAHYQDGSRRLDAKDFRGALDIFEPLVQLAGHLVPDFYLALCITHERMLEWGTAVSLYRTAIRHHPDDAKLHKNFCATLLRVLQESTVPGVHDHVHDVCYQALALDSRNIALVSLLGDMHTLRMEWGKAVAQYTEAVAQWEARAPTESFPEFSISKTLANLANTLSRAGHVKEAISVAQQVCVVSVCVCVCWCLSR